MYVNRDLLDAAGLEVPTTWEELRGSAAKLTRKNGGEAVWGFEREIEENTLDAFVRLVRSKVDRDFKHKLIHTVRGVGYTVRQSPKP